MGPHTPIQTANVLQTYTHIYMHTNTHQVLARMCAQGMLEDAAELYLRLIESLAETVGPDDENVQKWVAGSGWQAAGGRKDLRGAGRFGSGTGCTPAHAEALRQGSLLLLHAPLHAIPRCSSSAPPSLDPNTPPHTHLSTPAGTCLSTRSCMSCWRCRRRRG